MSIFSYNGNPLTFESASFRNCVVCRSYAYGELVAGVHVCYKCIFGGID